MPTFGSLFAGIGGFDLGLERAGWTCRWQVEIDPFCQRVLARHWPDVARYGDIRTLDPERLERVDLICGGFPCQPVSVAGKRRAQADERWLWPEFSRIVRALRPRLVLVENVPGLLVRGFGDVVGDLATSGYDAEWDCVGAADVGAPHQRDRVWIVAYPHEGDGRTSGAREDQAGATGLPLGAGESPDVAYAIGESQGGRSESRPITSSSGRAESQGDQRQRNGDASGRGSAAMANASLDGRDARGARDGAQEPRGRQSHRGRVFADFMGDANRASPDSHAEGRGPRGAARESGWWAVEPDVGRVAHGVPARVDRLRGLGNAVVPQVAEWIGRRLMKAIA